MDTYRNLIEMRREPGVYVTIEDASYVAPPEEAGRTVFCVGICDRGPHNQVVTVTSQEEFIRKFGKPDFKRTSQSHYNMNKAMQYTGRGLYVRVSPVDALVSNVSIKENSSPIITIGTADEFTFTEGSNEVVVDSSVFDQFVEGEWIYSADSIDSSIESRQIISKNSTTLKYILDDTYGGATNGWGIKSTMANKFTPYIQSNDTFAWDIVLRDESSIDPECVYTFIATGSGKYYDGLKIKASRNTELEKMYTDDDGNVKYKYLFMTVGVYMEQEDSQRIGDKLVEGPWTVSLVNKTPDGKVIRDLSSGNIMFLPEIINKNSELVRCVAGQAIRNLSLPESVSNNIISEKNRFNTMLLMSSSQPVGTTNYVSRGNALQFSGGFDGTTNGQPLFDSSENLYQDQEVWGLCKLAFEGALTSVDGSIEQLREVTYPLYEPDRI